MALFGALSIGRSGLINSGAALSVIGNNIANVNTTGFKGSRVEFADLLSADAGGDIGKIGLGARIGTVRTLFTQGSIEATGRALDLGIDGQGQAPGSDEPWPRGFVAPLEAPTNAIEPTTVIGGLSVRA